MKPIACACTVGWLVLNFLVVPCRADVKSAAAREVAEYVVKKFGKEAGEEGVELLAKKIETLAVRHGDEVFEAVRKVGPRAIRYAEEAGENGPRAIGLMARFGDDAVWVRGRGEGVYRPFTPEDEAELRARFRAAGRERFWDL